MFKAVTQNFRAIYLHRSVVIEQCLMRNLKTLGGLTHGSGMTETQRTIWALSMPVCAQVHDTMQEVSGIKTQIGDQNEDFGPSRVARDWKDTSGAGVFQRKKPL